MKKGQAKLKAEYMAEAEDLFDELMAVLATLLIHGVSG